MNDKEVRRGVSQIITNQGRAEKHSEARNNKSTRKVISALIITATVSVVCSGIVHWNIGYPISAQLGLVPADTQSGYNEHKELIDVRNELKTVNGELRDKNQRHKKVVDRLQSERQELEKLKEIHAKAVARIAELEATDHEKDKLLQNLKDENDNSKRKMQQNAETMLVYQGVMRDKTNYLEQARYTNKYRQEGYYGEPHTFGFKNWFIPIQTYAIRWCIEHGKISVLRWITREDGWNNNITKELEAKALLAIEKPDEIVPFEITKKQNNNNKRKLRYYHAWFHDDPSYVDGTRKGLPKPIGLDGLSNRWLKTFLDNIERDNRTNLLHHLEFKKLLPANRRKLYEEAEKEFGQ